MAQIYDVAIVGAGSMGMAAGYYLVKRGLRVLMLDAFDPPHTNGSHHSETRIIRHAYGEGESYVPLALRAQELWKELEQETGFRLFSPTGVLNLGAPGSRFLEEVKRSAGRYGLPIDVLSAAEICERWPGIKVPEGFTGCFESASGVLFSEECIRAYRQRAEEQGAAFLPNTPVERIEIHDNGATLHTRENRYFAESLIVSAGAWAGRVLADAGLHLPLEPVRKTVAWFEAEEALFREGVFPAFVVDLLDEFYYGFPSFEGSGVKVGRHDGRTPVDPDRMDRTFGADPADEGDVRRFLSRFMPRAAGRLKRGAVCLYTYTPDEHFIVDRHPEHSHVVIAAGFSGHGFKFSSAIGEAVAELTVEGKSSLDLSQFSLRRFDAV
jgi:sarcosine oxidase/N-methyl-L-tryptophan oxidase